MTRTRGWLAAVAAVCMVLAAPAVASAQETPSPEGDRAQWLEVACARIPNLQRRTANLIERLPAGEDTRGSLAWLQVRADRARMAGREGLADAIDDRIAVLAERLDVLPARQERLTELAADCAVWLEG